MRGCHWRRVLRLYQATVPDTGDALDAEHTHWFRAKFFQQYRLFFRYHAQGRIIVYGWVNDEESKRAYGTADDAYRVFRRMLDSGHPPSDWDSLMAEVRAEGERLAQIVGRPEPEASPESVQSSTGWDREQFSITCEIALESRFRSVRRDLAAPAHNSAFKSANSVALLSFQFS